MSKLTEVLKLLCYDPETDGNLTFNVTEALTKNWEKIDQLVLLAVAAAAAYDPEGSYAVGDYCTHGGKLHKCGTAIPDGEAWNAEHWTETSVAAELAEVRASLSNKVPYVAMYMSGDIADIPTKTGAYYIGADVTGKPFEGECLGFVVSDGYTQQLYLYEGSVEHRRYGSGSIWNDWEVTATATPPEEHAIVPKNGATLIDGMKNVFSKDQFGKIAINVGMNFESVPAKGTEIFSLPQSFAPAGGIDAGATVLSMGTACYPAFLTVNTDGAVVLQHNVTDYSGQIDLFGFMCFGTGGTQ